MADLARRDTKARRWVALVACLLGAMSVLSAPTHAASSPGAKTPIVIPNGDVQLRGWFFSAGAEGPRPLAIVLHGFPGTTDDPLGLGARLAARGAHALTFNYSGTYESGGEFTMRGSQLDIAAAVAFARAPENVSRFRIDPDRIVLGGHSFGGGMALTFASNHDFPRRVFGLAPSDSAHIAREMRLDPELEAVYRQVFEDLSQQGVIRMAEGLDELLGNPTPWDLRLAAPRLANRAIFLASGVDDLDTPLETEVLPVYRALKSSGNESVVLETYPTDHSFGGVVERVASDLVTWLEGSDQQ